MFQILKDTKFDFMGTRKIWLSISAVLVVASLAIVAVKGVNLGIEFRGGTEVQVKYTHPPDLGAVRSVLGAAGLSDSTVTTIGDAGENEVYIRLSAGKEEGAEHAGAAAIAALRSAEVKEKISSGMIDLNTVDQESLLAALQALPDVGQDEAKSLSEAILERRREADLFRSADELSSVPGMRAEVLEGLKARSFAGPFAVRSQSFIGPVIGAELVRKAVLAILGSMAGMLIYIAFRFQVDMGIAAVVALIHDTIVTLGLFSLFGYEMSLPVVAAFLTLIGYSVNDTVVIFDRIRENQGKGGYDDVNRLINDSVNQTLSRTILTSLLTWLVVLCLFFFGGEELRPFSFVMTVGIVVGSYSTIYIASPVLVAWQNRFGKKKGQPPAPAAGPRKATKVRKASTQA